MDDDSLMARATQGDTDAFGVLVRRYQRRVVRFAHRLLAGDADAAEDAAQETFLRLWRARARYRPQGRLGSLLLQIARNVCRDFARAARPTEPLDEAREVIPSPDQDLPCVVREAIESLPEPQRAVFVLSHFEGLSYDEIARILDCPVGTVGSRKHLAVEALRQRLRPWTREEKGK